MLITDFFVSQLSACILMYSPSATLIFHRDKRNIQRETVERSILEKHGLSTWHFFLSNHLTSQQCFSVRYSLCIAISRVLIMGTVQTQILASEKFYASVKLAHARYSRGAFEVYFAYTNAASDALFLPLRLKKPRKAELRDLRAPRGSREPRRPRELRWSNRDITPSSSRADFSPGSSYDVEPRIVRLIFSFPAVGESPVAISWKL